MFKPVFTGWGGGFQGGTKLKRVFFNLKICLFGDSLEMFLRLDFTALLFYKFCFILTRTIQDEIYPLNKVLSV